MRSSWEKRTCKMRYPWYSYLRYRMTRRDFAQLRKKLGLSQARLAAKMGTTAATVSRWESGKRPIPEIAARLLRLLAKDQ